MADEHTDEMYDSEIKPHDEPVLGPDSLPGSEDAGDTSSKPAEKPPNMQEDIDKDRATLEDDGVIAQGQGATAVGERGTHTEGDVGGSNITGDVKTNGGDVVGRDKKSVSKYYGAVTQITEIRSDIQIDLTEADNETVIKKFEHLFVPPPSYSQFISNNDSLRHRVLLINGPEHADKFGCAIKVGLDLFQPKSLPQFYIYKRRSTASHSLLDFASYKDLPGSAVFILENVFETGVMLLDLSEKFIVAISSKLKEKNNILILTSNYPDDRLAELTALDHLNAQVVDLEEVLNKYLDYYQESDRHQLPEALVKLAKQDAKELLRKLQSTLQIEQFCIKLSQLSLESENTSGDEKNLANQMRDLADRVGNASQETLRQWFASLSFNHKLFAMLVVLLPNLDFLSFAEFYNEAVQKLRAGDVPLEDPRKQSIAEILAAINAVETASHQIQFTSLAYKQEVQRQIRNYHPLLWSLIELLLDIVGMFKRAEYWELRRELGGAIGAIGIEHRPKLADLLTRIADFDHHGVQVVAGYALAEIAYQKRHHAFIIELLETWAKSGQSKLMWTAVASVWRIYDNIAELVPSPTIKIADPTQGLEDDSTPLAQIAEIVTHLAQTSDDDNVLTGIVFALRIIAQNHATYVVELIKNWLDQNNEELHFMGRLVAFDLFYTNKRLDVLPTLHQHQPLLDLIKPLLTTEFEIIDIVMSTLLMWMDDTEWHLIIHKALLDIANHASDLEHQALREGIVQHWMTSENEAARKIGQALLLRSYVMQGYPVDLSGHHFNLLAIDNSRAAKRRLQNVNLGRHLYHHMLAWSDLALIQLGHTRSRIVPGDYPNANWAKLLSRYPTPRLIYPPLNETCNKIQSHSITIVSWGPVADFEDAFPPPLAAASCILAIETGDEWTKPLPSLGINDISREFIYKLHEPFSVLHLPSITDKDTHNLVFVWLHSQIAKDLALRDPNIWWKILAHHFPQGPDNLDEIYDTLGNWASDIVQHESNVFPDDSARRVACTLLWLAGVEVEQCTRLLSNWVTEGATEDGVIPPTPRRLLGIACTKMLFDLYGPYATELSAEKASALLHLLPMLNNVPDPSLVKTILIAVRHWLTVSTLHNELVNTNSKTFESLVELLRNPALEQNRDELLAILQYWKHPLKQRGEEDSVNTTRQLAEQLSLYLFTGDSIHLPPIESGQQYAFIVFDASGIDNPERRHFALVAQTLIEELRESMEELMILVFHLGSMYPIPIQNGDIKAEKLLPSRIERRPRLLAPILEQTSIDNVRFVLLFTGGPVIDQADWEQRWQERVKIYSMRKVVPWSGDLEVYPYPGLDNRVSPSVAEAAAKLIARELNELGVE